MTVKRADVKNGKVVGDGKWAVGVAHDKAFAVSRKCRHQFADLAEGSVDAEGCLVCPWHQARYDVTNGRMVSGPRGVFGYHGPLPGLSGAIKLMTRVLPLKVGKVKQAGGNLTVE